MPHTWYVHKLPDWGSDLLFPDTGWYRLLMPQYNEPGFYRQTVSFNAFFHTWNKKLSRAIDRYGLYDLRINKHKPNHMPDGHLLMVHPDNEYEMELRMSWADAKRKAENFRIKAEFKSIWEFYEFIGFDYKTRKYKP